MRHPLNILRMLYYWMDTGKYLILIGLSTIVHFLFTFFYESTPGIDGVIYQRIASEIIESGSIAACGAFTGAYWPPLFCYHLAAFWSVFGNLQWLFYVLNVLIALGTTLISAYYLRKIFGDTVSLWATFFFYNSMIIYYFTMYYKYELLTALFLSVSFALILDKKILSHRIILGGFFLGLAALATGRVLVLLPALLYYIYMAFQKQSTPFRLARGGLLILGVVIALAPWTTRNYHCLGKFIPITTNSGINFYMGFNEYADGSYMHQYNLPEPYDSWDRTDNGTFYSAGINYIIENPGGAISLLFRKLNILWRIHYADMTLFYPFFYIGIFLLVRKGWVQNYYEGRFVQLVVLLYTLFHLFFIARYYYVIPILPLVYATAVRSQKGFFGYLHSKF